MYVRSKRIKGQTYYYLVKSERRGKKVTQKFIRYLGKAGAGTLPPLEKEARKYKSAEEFVKSQPKLFHGTRKDTAIGMFDLSKVDAGVEILAIGVEKGSCCEIGFWRLPSRYFQGLRTTIFLFRNMSKKQAAICSWVMIVSFSVTLPTTFSPLASLSCQTLR